ncbi:Spermidine/putrescine-binding periplasmic protein [uncultured Pleomorphomonas sp.]|uniref:Spermidine/putrescine-binding periplasmic protein n=1 Tax=uncultured Pleomorphomonas sp. TaxID=442121 RepID=A0A212LFX4_9HYPH|nr:ABC transporter substrate-binding protein [uncultured Pleomorphomonas sp.]SCM76463.1 Spermidine/putrescine-binding periplasmic protein [uncultured Pleomorphomonas sp.]
MLKRTSRILTLAAGIALSGPALARDLTIVSWGGALQDGQKVVYFEPFQAETGIKLIDESWDGGIGVLRAKIEGGNADWDVVEVESEELAIGCEEGLFEKLDYSKIGGKDAYLPAAVSDCGVGNIVWDFILAYDGDKLADGPKSWADFFDVEKFPGKRALRQGPKSNLEIALMADGVAPKDVYSVLKTPEGVERAFNKLDSIKSDVIFWKAGAQPPQLLASGEVVMTSAYNGRVTAANEQDKKNFKIVWNGALYTIDSWVILKDSPNIDAAYAFLDFAGKAERQKDLPKYVSYGVTNQAATTLIDPARLPVLPTAPENIANAQAIDDQFWLENLDRLNERFNKWAAQ